MELSTFAVDHGYPEAILRGFRSAFLTELQYQSMQNCQNMAELKNFLEETDYAPFLQAENNDIAITTLKERLREKLAGEIEYIQNQSVGELGEFLQLMRHKYMIDNVVNIIEQLRADPKAKFTGTHPLGHFEGMNNIKVMEGDDLGQLYRDVLIDTPVGPYFVRFIEENLASVEGNKSMAEAANHFKEMKPEHIRNSLKKMWLEDFYTFCSEKLSGVSQEMLTDLLKTEADYKTIQVCYNTIGTQNATQLITLRKSLSPSFGYLYPDCDDPIKKATTIDQLRDAVKGIETYKNLLKDAQDPQKIDDFTFATTTLEDLMFECECLQYSLAFDQAAHYAVFYAYVKLKELEIRNIIWVAEMITRNLKKGHPGWKKIIVPFAPLVGNKN